MIKMKMFSRLIEKGREKGKKVAAPIDYLKTDILITTVEDLQKREAAIVSLSLPETVKEAELKVLVTRQIQLRMKVYKQKGVRVLLTDNGKGKSGSRLSLLASCRIKHRFEENGSLVWYEANMLSSRKQQVRVHYPDTDELSVCT